MEGKGKADKCKHSTTITLVAKTTGNNGRQFKKCKACEKWLGWVIKGKVTTQ